VKRQQRVLVTTLTKRMAEELTEYYQELGVKVAYLHSDIDTLARHEIIDGELAMAAAPRPDHQTVELEPGVIFVRPVRELWLGKVCTVPTLASDAEAAQQRQRFRERQPHHVGI
ncbi:MAG TPA: hypothetical protein VLK82_13390, partial [Candidatus Tectomicrobia bacterium]|nr:hypothetical protein [Candidatus Tectomicrobia bacterium]